jgi:hypothetical protein
MDIRSQLISPSPLLPEKRLSWRDGPEGEPRFLDRPESNLLTIPTELSWLQIMIKSVLILSRTSLCYFLFGLYSDAFISPEYSVEMLDDSWIINWKGFGKKLWWPNLRCCPAIYLEGLRNTTKYFGHIYTISSPLCLFRQKNKKKGNFVFNIRLYEGWSEALNEPQAGLTVLGTIFEPRTSRIRSKSANHSTKTFGFKDLPVITNTSFNLI